MKNTLSLLFHHYLKDSNRNDFRGWEDVEVYFSPLLSDAWMRARPQDAVKFEDTTFKAFVDEASGKWLEKTSISDKYKILISTEKCKTEMEVLQTFIHELRHCLDYQNAVESLEFHMYHPGNIYYNNWSEFRSVVEEIRFCVYEKSKNCTSKKDLFHLLSGILGQWNTDCVEGLMKSDTINDKLYYISRHIGASRAIRNLSIDYQLNSNAFHLWNMMPYYIYENFGYVFYIGNEWDDMTSCSLDQIPSTYYYDALLRKMSGYQEAEEETN
jgi:hypothetical protein